MKPILFSGIKPTGTPHLGNYLGALKNWVELQNENTCLYAIVDQHAITINITPTDLHNNTLKLAKILLAIGIDPKKSIFFLQSHVPAHAELAWIFNCLLPVVELKRMTQYKDKANTHKKNVNMGLFDYPVLMAADILLYRAEIVPVGEDQLQHLELARLVARKFNQRYKKYFTEPKAKLTNTARVMSLLEPNKKMSKDLGEKNYISLIDNQTVVKKKVMRAVTDDGGTDNKISSGVKNLFELLKNLGPSKVFDEMMLKHQNKTLKYADLKTAVIEAINFTLKPIQEKYAHISDSDVLQILADGSEQANEIANKNIKQIKNLVGFI